MEDVDDRVWLGGRQMKREGVRGASTPSRRRRAAARESKTVTMPTFFKS